MPCERKCDPDQSKTGWGWIPERCPWTPSGGMGARRRLPTVATVMDHNALRGDPLLHHQSRLSQKERVAGVQLTPIIRSLSDPRASCPWCACNTSSMWYRHGCDVQPISRVRSVQSSESCPIDEPPCLCDQKLPIVGRASVDSVTCPVPCPVRSPRTVLGLCMLSRACILVLVCRTGHGRPERAGPSRSYFTTLRFLF